MIRVLVVAVVLSARRCARRDVAVERGVSVDPRRRACDDRRMGVSSGSALATELWRVSLAVPDSGRPLARRPLAVRALYAQEPVMLIFSPKRPVASPPMPAWSGSRGCVQVVAP